MWSDNEAKDDFLNFSILASVIAETIKSNGDKPLSIGVSGAWGVGKSSTLELLAAELNRIEPKPLIVRFHPWRHQSQDNVRATFAECIARELTKCEGIGGEIKKKAQSILKRANLIRIAGYGLGGALTLATGLPIGGFFSKGIDAIAGTIDGDLQKADIDHAVDFAKTAQQKIGEWFPEGEKEHSPYENIEKICEEFGKALEMLDRRLIVLIDDLDRCLPETTIEALEAMRLYFFVPRTVFVIAADARFPGYSPPRPERHNLNARNQSDFVRGERRSGVCAPGVIRRIARLLSKSLQNRRLPLPQTRKFWNGEQNVL